MKKLNFKNIHTYIKTGIKHENLYFYADVYFKFSMIVEVYGDIDDMNTDIKYNLLRRINYEQFDGKYKRHWKTFKS